MLKLFFLKIDYEMCKMDFSRYTAQCRTAALDGMAISATGSIFPAVVGVPHASVPPRPVLHLMHWLVAVEISAYVPFDIADSCPVVCRRVSCIAHTEMSFSQGMNTE